MRLYDNALPFPYFTGIKDTPYAGVGPSEVVYPLHTPLSWVMAAWGEVGKPYSVLGDELISTFTKETFNSRGKFYTHSTDFVEVINGAVNRQLVTRVPLPNMQAAMLRLSIELVETNVKQLEREDLSNKPKLDTDGNLVYKTDAVLVGHQYRWLIEPIKDPKEFGKAQVKDGELTSTTSGTAKVYPVWDFQATFEGERGNDFAISLFAESGAERANSTLMKALGAYLYRLEITETKSGVNVPWYTIGNDRGISFTFEDGVYHPDTNVDYSLSEVYPANYINREVPHSGQETRGAIDASHIYDENIKTVSDQLFKMESETTAQQASKPAIGTDSRSINLMSGLDFEGNPYYTIEGCTGPGLGELGILLTEGAKFKLLGGNDGDVSLKEFDKAVRTILLEKGRGEVEYNDFAHYPFTAIWDSGYSLETKEAMAPWTSGIEAANFLRMVPLQTAVAGEVDYLTMDEEISIAGRLYHSQAAYVESKIWNTPATRGAIVPWSGIINKNNDPAATYKGTVSPNRWLLLKTCQMLGNSNRKWNNNLRPDLGDEKIIDTVILKNYRYGSKEKREDLYSNQCMMIELLNSRDAIVASYQTINPNDSSTLNNWWNVWACITAGIGCYFSYKYLVGGALSESDLKQNAEGWLNEFLNGCAQQYAVYTPEIFYTKDDSAAGYAWSTRCGVGMNGGKTVNTVEINSYAFDAANTGA